MNSNPQFERRAREGFSLHRLPEISVAGERLGVAGRGFGQTSGGGFTSSLFTVTIGGGKIDFSPRQSVLFSCAKDVSFR